MSWQVIETDETVEVLPDFGAGHTIGGQCWCGPAIKGYDRALVIHECEN